MASIDTTSTKIVQLAVERGLLSPDQARQARSLTPEQMVDRGFIERREMEMLIKMTGAPVVIFNRYEVIAEIGRGGMGVVYKCRDLKLDRVVAVKRIGGGMAADVDRFEREARTAARLKHPNIVAVHDFGHEHGEMYLTMDFIPGKSLDKLVQEGVLDARQIAAVIKQIAEALAYAHQHGVIHRDLKPDNILVNDRGRAYLTDFGLARRVEGDVTLTVSGMIMGTPPYMSPEQAAGQKVDFRSDLYSLGASLYHALTGRLPHVGSSPIAVVMDVMSSDPPAPRAIRPSIPRDLETVTLKAMAREPERRYPGAREFGEDLGRFLKDEPITASRPSWTQLLRRRVKRHPLAWGAAAAVLVAALGVSVYLIVQSRRAAELNEQLRLLKEADKGKPEKLAEQTAALGRNYAALLEKLREPLRRAGVYAHGLPPPAAQVEKLLAEVEKAIAELPEDQKKSSLPHAVRGWALAALGRDGEAEFKKAEEQGLDKGDPFGPLFRVRRQVHEALMKFHPVVELQFRKGVPKAPDLGPPLKDVVEWPGWSAVREGGEFKTLAVGLWEFRQGHTAEAARTLEGLAGSDDLGLEAKHLTAVARWVGGDLEGAQKILVEAFRLTPSAAVLLERLAQVKAARGEAASNPTLLQDAVRDYDNVIQADLANARPQVHRAHLLKRLGDMKKERKEDPLTQYGDALEAVTAALQIDREHPEALELQRTLDREVGVLSVDETGSFKPVELELNTRGGSRRLGQNKSGKVTVTTTEAGTRAMPLAEVESIEFGTETDTIQTARGETLKGKVIETEFQIYLKGGGRITIKKKDLQSLKVVPPAAVTQTPPPPDPTPKPPPRTTPSKAGKTTAPPPPEPEGLVKPAAVVAVDGVIRDLTFSADGRWLIFLNSSEGKVQRVDLKTRALDAAAADTPAGTLGLAMSPDGQGLWAFASPGGLNQSGEGPGEGILQRINPGTLAAMESFKTDFAPFDAEADDAGRLYATSALRSGREMAVIDTKKRAVVKRWEASWYSAEVKRSPDGSRLYFKNPASSDHVACIVLPSDLQAQVRPYEGKQYVGESFAISPDSRYLVGGDGTVLRLARTQIDDLKYAAKVEPHTASAMSKAHLWVAAKDGRLIAYSMPEFKLVNSWPLKGHLYEMTLEASGKVLIGASARVKPAKGSDPERSVADLAFFELGGLLP